MTSKLPYRRHLSRAKDLVTSYQEIRAGFIALALEKNRRATPTVEEARALKFKASSVKMPKGLLNIKGIQPALLTASGVSDKAASHMLHEDKVEAIKNLIENFLEPAGTDFIEELVFRFLLTRGDALGGSMRNIGGALAQKKLTRAIISTLRVAGITMYWLPLNGSDWVEMGKDDTDIESQLKGLGWTINSRNRTLIYNIKVSIVNKSVDLSLLDCEYDKLSECLKSPNSYIALGELKGGIDPAGADEHWKTANTSLGRIRKSFSKQKHNPNLFFVGAAIAEAMAQEIWGQLQRGELANAANLTIADQVSSICHWLCNL